MKKRILAVFLAAAALACSLSACGGATTQTTAPSDETTPSSGAPHANELNVGIAQDLDDSLDPYQMTAAGTREVMFNVFEGLVKPDSSGNYVNAVASDVSVSEDGLTYVFTLRDNVVFHNGAACTPDDVLYSFETCAATSVTSAVVEALSAVTSMTADGNQITMVLSAPNSDFLSYVASVYIVPAGYTEQATQPVGTGPFKFVSRSVQENIILEKHDEYYGEPAHLDKVTYKIYEDNTALFTALSDGRTSALISFARTFGFLMAGLLLLPRIMGDTGVWIAVPVAEAVSCLLSIGFLWHYRAKFGYGAVPS